MQRFWIGNGSRVSLGLAIVLSALTIAPATPAVAATPAVVPPSAIPAVAATSFTSPATVTASTEGAGSLESAATKAGEIGRKIAMSLIGLGFAIASIVLAFKRDFKEAAGIFAVGLVAILLATPTGVNVLRDTVNTLFGSS
jgi:hypothetical protein